MKNFEFILEAGVNHNGDLKQALELVHQASLTGANYIKFQTYSARKLAAKHSPSYWDLDEESTNSQVELFSKYDGLTKEDYFELAQEASRFGIGFMSTCFDPEWVDLLDEIMPQYKIASADITNFSLIRHIAEKGKKILLSTGASTFSEITNAVELIREISSADISLLHCVLNYPTPASRAALGRITDLKKSFPNHEIGYSDHTKPEDSAQAIQIAYDLGARVFEKHFTLTPESKGNDHYHSFDTKAAKSVIRDLQKVDVLTQYTELDFINNQVAARNFARRGLYASKDLIVGEIIDESALIPLRPPIELDGFGGEQFYALLGKKIKIQINAGEPIRSTHVE